MLRRLLGLVSRGIGAVVRAVQKVVLTVSLFVVYFLGVGLTRLLAMAFDRRLVRGTPVGRDTYWLDARGYDPDPGQAARQS